MHEIYMYAYKYYFFMYLKITNEEGKIHTRPKDSRMTS